jgi:hypothetical protein
MSLKPVFSASPYRLSRLSSSSFDVWTCEDPTPSTSVRQTLRVSADVWSGSLAASHLSFLRDAPFCRDRIPPPSGTNGRPGTPLRATATTSTIDTLGLGFISSLGLLIDSDKQMTASSSPLTSMSTSLQSASSSSSVSLSSTICLFAPAAERPAAERPAAERPAHFISAIHFGDADISSRKHIMKRQSVARIQRSGSLPWY